MPQKIEGEQNLKLHKAESIIVVKFAAGINANGFTALI